MFRTRHPGRVAIGVALVGAALVAAPAATGEAQRQAGTSPANVSSTSTPHHVVFIVLDQLRPEFIDAFHMRNVQALMAGGTNFKNASLGHMGSETVVSLNVLTTGRLPKDMGCAVDE